MLILSPCILLLLIAFFIAALSVSVAHYTAAFDDSLLAVLVFIFFYNCTFC